MTPDPRTVAAIRFGFGFRPGHSPVAGAEGLLAQLERPSADAQNAAPLAERVEVLAGLRKAQRAIRQGVAGGEAGRMAAVAGAERLADADQRRLISRALDGAGFVERLALFWTDHFTVSARNRPLIALLPDMIETAIRPHLAGPFGDMLKAVVTHPAMLIYLDQAQSVGPGSAAGQRRGRGLNENLAREVLELHTLGVGGGYSQADVRAFAELLTGLSVDPDGFRFRPGIAQPGRKTVLGRTYGRQGRARMDDALAALDDLAVHPDTCRHLARKLIVHFIGGVPDASHVAQVAAALSGGGTLAGAYQALLDHPAAWAGPFNNAKPPFDFVVSALRALGIGGRQLAGLGRKEMRRGLLAPMMLMGQRPFAPPGPDGWPEEPEAWITAAGLAARIRWANALAARPEAARAPSAFLEVALGDAADGVLRRAVAGAETRAEGVALVLASPAFNRR